MLHTGILFVDNVQLAAPSPQGGGDLLLVPVLGKPLLQRALEKLVKVGCKQIHILLGTEPGPTRAFLQQGERWGCQLSFHYPQPQESLAQLARRLGVQPQDHYWLGCCSCIPVDPLDTTGGQSTENILLYDAVCEEPCWSGWGYLAGSWLLAQGESIAAAMTPAGLLAKSPEVHIRSSQMLDAHSLPRLHASTLRLLAQEQSATPSRRSHIHPSACLIEPVYIGSDVYIGAGCVIGPEVVIESGAYLASGSQVKCSLILSHTYVGQDLDLFEVIAQGDCLFNLRTGCQTRIHDPLWLRDLTPQQNPKQGSQRLLALLLRLVLWPLYALSQWRQKRDCDSPREQSPAGEQGHWTNHFHRIFYPGLRRVQAGDMTLLGPSLRNLSMDAEFPDNWLTLYPLHRPGLINEALFCPPEDQSLELLLASDLLACTHQNHWAITLTQLGRYLKLVLHDGLHHHQKV